MSNLKESGVSTLSTNATLSLPTSGFGIQLQNNLAQPLYVQTLSDLVMGLDNQTLTTNLQSILSNIDTMDNNLSQINTSIDQINTNITNLQSSQIKMEVGSYTGTGVSGPSSPNSLIFNLQPRLVIVQSNTLSSSFMYSTGIFVYNSTHCTTYIQYFSPSTLFYYSVTNWNNNGISWYAPAAGASSAPQQLNITGQTYNYIAFGI